MPGVAEGPSSVYINLTLERCARKMEFDRFGKGQFEEVHGRNEIQFPQLELRRPHLNDIPEIRLPHGYSMRHYRQGDERAWGEIMTEAFNPYWDEHRFNILMKPHYGFRPERVIFVLCDGVPVGSASAFRWPGAGRGRGYIHMVGVKKEHCGAGLGYWLTAACISRFREEGLHSAMLQTEDFRIPAIKHYIRLGFKPFLVIEEHRAKWLHILERIGRPDLADKMDIRGMPVMGKARFWYRTMLVSNYMSWLNFKADMMGG